VMSTPISTFNKDNKFALLILIGIFSILKSVIYQLSSSASLRYCPFGTSVLCWLMTEAEMHINFRIHFMGY
jgi:hypothetical protein